MDHGGKLGSGCCALHAGNRLTRLGGRQPRHARSSGPTSSVTRLAGRIPVCVGATPDVDHNSLAEHLLALSDTAVPNHALEYRTFPCAYGSVAPWRLSGFFDTSRIALTAVWRSTLPSRAPLSRTFLLYAPFRRLSIPSACRRGWLCPWVVGFAPVAWGEMRRKRSAQRGRRSSPAGAWCLCSGSGSICLV